MVCSFMPAHTKHFAVRRLAAAVQLLVACLGFVVLPGAHLYNHEHPHRHSHDEQNGGDPLAARLTEIRTAAFGRPERHSHPHPHNGAPNGHAVEAQDGLSLPEAADRPSHAAPHGAGSLSHLQKSLGSTETTVVSFAAPRVEQPLTICWGGGLIKRHSYQPRLPRGPPSPPSS